MENSIPRLKQLIEWATLVVAILVPATAASQGLPDELRVSAHIPLSPFDHVTYEVKRVGSTTAVALTRFHADDYGSDSELELVSAEGYAAAMLAASVCQGAGASPEPPEVPTIGWLEVVTSLNGIEERAILRADLDGAAHDTCLEAMRTIAASVLRIDAYQLPFWDEGEFGMLRATANLPARLYLDGRRTGLITPVNALRLEPGIREVLWVAIVTGQEVLQSVTVVAGMTTQVTATFEEALPAEHEAD
jgi:hypothetical protein